jgi:Type I phosphodiesterase / nucleotide pyrophosphatase
MVGALALASIALALYARTDDSESNDTEQKVLEGSGPASACSTPLPILERLARGYHPTRSGDVLLVERRYSQIGRTRHSSPYPQHQEIPLVLYGPGFIESGRVIDRSATVADIVPTLAELMGFEGLPDTDGAVLREALASSDGRPPRLIVTVVWDGGGDNVLEQWPESWPNLRRLMQGGTYYENATVGSTPSITPAVHATIGTGNFPSTHGVVDTHIRVDGKLIDPWEGDLPLETGAEMSPAYLEGPTLADLWDRAQGNRSKVGLIAWDSWHLGMLGHGSFYDGADADIAAIHRRHGAELITNDDYYALPSYLKDTSVLTQVTDEVDEGDGQLDGRWLGKPLDPNSEEIGFTPVWPIFQTHQIKSTLERENFGRDEVTDLFFTNYKSADMEAHRSSFKSEEVRELIEEQDRGLGEIMATAERLAGEGGYVVVVTADHGMTPYPEDSGKWSFDLEEVAADVERALDDVAPEEHLISRTRGFSLFLDPDELRRNELSAEDVARFLRAYPLQASATESNPVTSRFRKVADDPLFAVSVTGAELNRALACARSRS